MVVLRVEKDIEYLAKNFKTEMENFSFAKATIDVGAVWATVGAAQTAGAAAALGLGKIFAGAAKGVLTAGKDVVKNTTKSIPIPADFDSWIDKEKDERGDFYKKIIEYCEKKNIDEVDMYKKARLNRSIFSKIRGMGRTGYLPSKSTVVCICLALELSLQESIELLGIVGYSLSDKMIIDKIVGWCIKNNQFDVFKINNLIYDKTGESYFSLNFSSSY
jgi:hypothetical protein